MDTLRVFIDMKNYGQLEFMNKLKNSQLFLLLFIFLFSLIMSGCSTQQTTDSQSALNTTERSIEPSEEHKQSYQSALRALEQKDYKKAEALLKELSEEKPELAGPWANLGLIRLVQKKPNEAETYLLKSLKLNPKLVKVLNLLGLISIQNKKLKQAESYFQQAIDNNENYSNAHYNLALLYDVYLQNISKAALHYRRYSEITNSSDKETLDWLEQLENTLKQSL